MLRNNFNKFNNKEKELYYLNKLLFLIIFLKIKKIN